MNRHKNVKEIEMLKVFFRKNHSSTFTCDDTKVELTSYDVSDLIFKNKSNFSDGKVLITGPVMHIRFQPLWFSVLLELDATRINCLALLQYSFSIVDLIEKSHRVCQAIGIRTINYSLTEVNYFLSLLVEFRIVKIVQDTSITITLLSDVRREIDVNAGSKFSFTINENASIYILELANRSALFLTATFFSKRNVAYDLLQKLLLRIDGFVVEDMCPATVKDLKTLSNHGFASFTKAKNNIYIHDVSAFLEGLNTIQTREKLLS